MRTWYKGCALVSKARDVGSIPSVRAMRVDFRIGCNSVAKHFIRHTLKPAMISPRAFVLKTAAAGVAGSAFGRPEEIVGGGRDLMDDAARAGFGERLLVIKGVRYYPLKRVNVFDRICAVTEKKYSMRVKEKDAFEGLKRVARRYSENFEYAVVAAAYSVLTAIKKGTRFPLPSLDEIFKGEEDAPSFVREFIKKAIGNHWSEYQAIPGMFDEDRLVDFFADEAIGLLANARQVCVPDASVHALAAGLLDLDSKDRVCDLDCKIGSFVNTAWFRLWDVSGSDEGLEVTGVSTSETSAALTYIVSHANGVNATIRNADIFRP